MKMHKALGKVAMAMLLLCPTIKAGGGSLRAEDIARLRGCTAGEKKTWLRGVADGVRALPTEDCVLLPPHRDKPRIGQNGLNEYWFPPDTPPAEITKLVVVPQSIGGDDETACIWGPTKWRGPRRKTGRVG
jgi:hypothetical protein